MIFYESWSELTLLGLYFAGIKFREIREFLNVKFREDLISILFDAI